MSAGMKNYPVKWEGAVKAGKRDFCPVKRDKGQAHRIKKRCFGGRIHHALLRIFPLNPFWVWRDFLCAGLLQPPRCLSKATTTYIISYRNEDSLSKKSSAVGGTLTPLM